MIKRLIFVLSIIGLFVSGYLAYEYSLPTSINCPIGGQGCDIVRNSNFSKFLGISVPYLGVIYYLGVAAAAILLVERPFNNFLKKGFFLFALSGFLFSIYLTYLEAFIINAYCFWCIISAIIATIILVLSFGVIKNENRN
ncbi:MAG: Vitamin K epoxide reductase [Candidatus Daviesbacteria bacterium GW2011_GWA2_38_24]|uniref:Vitamin K epoxide reductase n=1 Tax=Candidatus Daviesbacteria bacterium GW2011_GWA2_38_24 TaxID=1618422 RepID=A0A0G0M123_9BACT|nr:MAG: Vitamin K epoxide reductase [Candidatus Daviesbacteria bacterium GW2011_GWA2_38_24]KKQ78645.1 MAG: Vitamin K epoxide reductase [Candidatus Daviesbacteria bacterium GW2011_GWA1_38_7]OGE23619.1 MAG: hypothetical protein A2688_00450 [Candidatus Daviesbacteria bacterium RIFCSPHIGHO2_01_FULL_38_8]